MCKNRALEQVKALLQADAACVHQNGVVGLFERGHGAVAVLIVALPDVRQHGGKVGGLAFLRQLSGTALGAGLGGNGTLIGASANVVLSGISAKHGHPITFGHYLKVGFPTMVLSVAISTVYLLVRFH